MVSSASVEALTTKPLIKSAFLGQVRFKRRATEALTVFMNNFTSCRFDGASEFIQFRVWCIVWVSNEDLLLWCNGSADSAQAHKGQQCMRSHGSAMNEAMFHCTDGDARTSLAMGDSRYLFSNNDGCLN